MKTINKVTIALLTTVAAASVNAGSLDYRAEYKHESETYAQRIKIGSSVKISDPAKLYFSVEQKFQSNDTGDFWNEVERGDSEFDWGVAYNLDKNWYIQPGMPITFADNKTTYKPQFRIGYKADFGLTTALRYRHEFQKFTADKNDGDTIQQGKITLTGSYKFTDEAWKNLQLSYEANYNHNYDDVILSNNDNWEWDLGVKIGYKIDNFRPYVEFWNIKGDDGKTTDDRQLRTRVGITYSF
ncbi:oligogalacturonate-specific porin KdgM family protein [Vibrio ishigakensis]|uniref:oligogalacturonate-specific porin KdgM family protein n=1 Tax=Vibrio ishigakensis TaxID=1481914 RepID=UPI0021C2E74D|nr:oligogalacturonate-specific porin KdgM family protein [Vibrio ishigakensis]